MTFLLSSSGAAFLTPTGFLLTVARLGVLSRLSTRLCLRILLQCVPLCASVCLNIFLCLLLAFFLQSCCESQVALEDPEQRKIVQLRCRSNQKRTCLEQAPGRVRMK